MFMELEKARAFGGRVHADHLYGERPYMTHLDDVYEILKEYGVTDKSVLVSAYLHDTAEDGDVSFAELVTAFGPRVGEIVFLVTDKFGVNRKARHEATYPALAEDEGATILKVADRIANARASVGTKLMKMYRKEYKYFKDTLYKETFKFPKMWEELDELLLG